MSAPPSTVFGFEVLGTDPATAARRGRLTTAHGTIETPVFMPVGTQGTVKGITPEQLVALGAEIILGNTYHLYLRPGTEVVAALGGLHRMAAWPRGILTDSGGYQVYSLRDIAKISEEGVLFQSHHDGSRHLLTPERSVEVQEVLGSDIMMCFDECPPSRDDLPRVRAAMERTHRWARRCVDARRRDDNALFGIVQGGIDPDLRRASVDAVTALPCEGFAIGGLSVGEGAADTYRTVALTAALLPASQPRYLMGVGTPEDLLTCVGLGVDMFDCVMPTRHARNARLFTSRGDINLRNARFRLDPKPIDPDCRCYTCSHFSRAYLRHLDRSKEILYGTLGTLHNLHFYLDLMAQAREHIVAGTFSEYREQTLARRREGGA
jgi:queuine tRNA-ribosyltransferase